jgi:hypothetical protein
MVERKQNKRISDPWFSEIEFVYDNNYYVLNSKNDNTIRINLVNDRTGEIRQKSVTVDQIARRCCESEISSSGDIELEDIK